MESILRSPPDISGPLRGPYVLQDGEDLVGEGQPLGGGASSGTGPRRDLDVLRHRQIGKDAALLRREPQPEPRDLVSAPLVERHVVEADATAPGAMVAHDGAECRGLPRAIASHQAHHLALPHLQRHAAKDVARLDEDVDVLDIEHSEPAPSPCPLPQWGRGVGIPSPLWGEGRVRGVAEGCLRPTTMSITCASASICAGAASASTLP